MVVWQLRDHDVCASPLKLPKFELSSYPRRIAGPTTRTTRYIASLNFTLYYE
jgi:hypothetical protein